MATFNVGDRITHSGFPGAVREVHTGVLEGMVTVALPGGQTCVAASEVVLVSKAEPSNFAAECTAWLAANRKA